MLMVASITSSYTIEYDRFMKQTYAQVRKLFIEHLLYVVTVFHILIGSLLFFFLFFFLLTSGRPCATLLKKILFPLRWRYEDLEKANNLPKVTELIKRSWATDQRIWLLTPLINLLIFLQWPIESLYAKLSLRCEVEFFL